MKKDGERGSKDMPRRGEREEKKAFPHTSSSSSSSSSSSLSLPTFAPLSNFRSLFSSEKILRRKGEREREKEREKEREREALRLRDLQLRAMREVKRDDPQLTWVTVNLLVG